MREQTSVAKRKTNLKVKIKLDFHISKKIYTDNHNKITPVVYEYFEYKHYLAKLNYGQPKPNSFLRFPVRFP